MSLRDKKNSLCLILFFPIEKLVCGLALYESMCTDRQKKTRNNFKNATNAAIGITKPKKKWIVVVMCVDVDVSIDASDERI